MATEIEIPMMSFPSAQEWERWLAENLGSECGIWMQLAKKGSGITTVTYDEALDVALCYGWIDGQKKSLDADFFLQKFTPRRKKSLWSKRNVGKALELIEAGRMQAAGLAEVELARKDGRWDAAYDLARDMTVPEDFVQAVGQDEKASAFFATLNKTNLYAIAWRLQTAKTPETRARRFAGLLEMVMKGEKFH